jgi:trk system potassium uptake protein TrkH
MNLRPVTHLLGTLLLFLAATMALPLGLALFYREPGATAFFTSALITGAVGLTLRARGEEGDISLRQAMAVVTGSWTAIAVLGGLPFWLGKALPTYIDGVFEAMAGVTTTGSTVFTAVEGVPHSYLFWRSFLQWIGGMGFIVLALAVLPKLSIGGRDLFEAEVPGPVAERLRPRIRQTAAVLWGLYAGLTCIQAILLLAGGMSAFEAVAHALSTMATGGFSTRNLSVESFNSIYFEIVMLIFMVISGANFTLHYNALRTGTLRHYWRSIEFRAYLALLAASTIIITADLWGTVVSSFFQAARLAAFQAVSVMTTTGFSSSDFSVWPPLAQLVLLLLIFMGGMSGSTSGGIKVVRIILVVKHIVREALRLIHPRAVRYITLDDKAVDEPIVSSALAFVLAYMTLFAAGTMALTAMGYDLVSSFTAVASHLSNIGPGLAMVGPHHNYAFLSGGAKILLTFLMLVGRLEIYSVLVLMLPQMWRRRTSEP